MMWNSNCNNYFQEAIGNRNTPLLQCHGDCDPIVPYRWGQMTASLLKQFMTQTEFKTYRGMMHASSEEVSSDWGRLSLNIFSHSEKNVISVFFFIIFTGNARHKEIHRKGSEAVIDQIERVLIFYQLLQASNCTLLY